MKYSDIPKLTYSPNTGYTVELSDLVDNIYHFTTDRGLDLSPDFQRGHVWSVEQQRLYIEFLLSGGQTNNEILINDYGWKRVNGKCIRNGQVLVDGKQRLEACMNFMNNKLLAFGTFYSEFTDMLPSRVHLVFRINKLESRSEVLKWYLELNSNGTPHTKTELERVSELLKEENESE